MSKPVPEGWKILKLDDLSTNIHYGITAKATDKKMPFKMLRTTDIKNYNADWNNLPYCEITEKNNNLNRYCLERDNLIVARAGTTGVSVLVDRDIPDALFGSYLIKIKLKQTFFSKFAHYFFQSNFYWSQIHANQAGSTLNNINLPILKSLKILLPSLPEQRKIAEILSSVDEAIEKTRAVIKQTKVVKKGLMQELLTSGIPGRHKKFKKTPVGEIPEEWEVIRLEKVATIERGKFQHRPRNEPRFYGGKYPFVQTGDVTESDGRIKNHSQTLNDEGLAISKLFPRGTILITIAANIGETAIAEFDLAFPDSLIGIVVNKSMDNRFLEYYLRTRKVHLNQIATESAQKNINLETLKPYPVPVPCKEEQKSIADFIECIEAKESNNKKIFDGLQLIKTALMQVLLTGEVRVKV